MNSKPKTVLMYCCILSMVFGCAEDVSEYGTSPAQQFKITYLLTEFEASPLRFANRNAESIYRILADTDEHTAYALYNGWHYAYDDNKTPADIVVPHAQESNYCKNPETDSDLDPRPPACDVVYGFQVNTANPFPFFGSATSFHLHGTAIGAGVGFGTYFADYEFVPVRVPPGNTKLRRNADGTVAATFSAGRTGPGGAPLCSDDADFAGTVAPAFDSVNRVPLDDSFDTSGTGDFVQKGKYAVSGSIYTAGAVYEDGDGVEQYELAYEHADTLKEPRCLGDMGQEGFVFWATGNTLLEVQLIVKETAPRDDGGVCDEDGGEKCYDHLSVTFQLDDSWREYHAPWDAFVQEGWGTPVVLDPNRIINIQFKVPGPKSGLPREFDLWLDHIGFYGGRTWPFTAAMASTDGQ